MNFSVTIERTQTPDPWTDADPEGEPARKRRLPAPGDWPIPAQLALQNNLRRIRDRLERTGTDSAHVALQITFEDDRAEVRATLAVDGEERVGLGADASLANALRTAMQELARTVTGDEPSVDPLPRPTPREQLVEGLTRYATQAVREREADGELPPGRIDPRDLSHTVVVERFAMDEPIDLTMDLPSLRLWIDALLDRYADTHRREVPLDPHAIGAPDRPRDDSLEHDKLMRALFALPTSCRYTFAEVVIDGRSVADLAARRSVPENAIADQLGKAMAQLANLLGRRPSAVLDAFTRLGARFRSEADITPGDPTELYH